MRFPSLLFTALPAILSFGHDCGTNAFMHPIALSRGWMQQTLLHMTAQIEPDNIDPPNVISYTLDDRANGPTRGHDDFFMDQDGENQPKSVIVDPIERLYHTRKRYLKRDEVFGAHSDVDLSSTELIATDISGNVLECDKAPLRGGLVAAGIGSDLMNTDRVGKIFPSVNIIKIGEPNDGDCVTSSVKGRTSKSGGMKYVIMEHSTLETGSVAEELDDSLGEFPPLQRQELRLEGFAPYILISVLTAHSSFDTIREYNMAWNRLGMGMSSVNNALASDDLLQGNIGIGAILNKIDWLALGIELSAVVSAICGVYSMFVLSLCTTYGKTALGMDRDEEYHIFMDNIGLQRFRAFKASTLSLFFWTLSVIMVECEQVPFALQLPLLGASGVLLYFLKREYDVISASAAPIFLPRKQRQK